MAATAMIAHVGGRASTSVGSSVGVHGSSDEVSPVCRAGTAGDGCDTLHGGVACDTLRGGVGGDGTSGGGGGCDTLHGSGGADGTSCGGGGGGICRDRLAAGGGGTPGGGGGGDGTSGGDSATFVHSCGGVVDDDAFEAIDG